MHLFHRGGRDGAVDDRNADVLQTVSAYGGRHVERARLHRVAVVDHDLAARGLEGFELLLGWLTAGSPPWHGFGEIRESGERRKQARSYGSHPPVKPARCSPRMMCGFVRMTRHT